MSIADPRSWKELPRQSRRDVQRLAKKGQRHPDPRTAQVAFEWALPRTSSRDGVLASLGIDVVFEALFGDAGVGAGATWAEARLARRIAALGDHKVDATP